MFNIPSLGRAEACKAREHAAQQLREDAACMSEKAVVTCHMSYFATLNKISSGCRALTQPRPFSAPFRIPESSMLMPLSSSTSRCYSCAVMSTFMSSLSLLPAKLTSMSSYVSSARRMVMMSEPAQMASAACVQGTWLITAPCTRTPGDSAVTLPMPSLHEDKRSERTAEMTDASVEQVPARAEF